MVHGGSCALATGKTTSAAVIANIRNKAIKVAIVLLLEILMYFHSPKFYSAWDNSSENPFYNDVITVSYDSSQKLKLADLEKLI
jgi:hypothetical protein